MKILLTGASGMLGTACRTLFAHQGVEFEALSRETAWSLINQCYAIKLPRANALIHAAANTDVEQCELEPDACYRDNYLLTEGLANVCAAECMPLIYISSTGVYGEGQSVPYREYSQVNPTTHHHRAKWLGEQAVLAASRMNLVIRTGWLFGGHFENPKNFVARRLEEANRAASSGDPLFSNVEQRGCPTFTDDVAKRILQLIQEKQRGLFNVVNEGNASRLEYVQAILASAGLTVPVVASSAVSFQRHAKVSSNETALNWRAAVHGMEPLPRWQESLCQYIRDNLPDIF